MQKVLSLDYWVNFIKFNIVGITGVPVNEGLYLLLKAYVYYLFADVVAIEVSIVTNFLLNDYWTFRDRRHGHMAVRFAKFNGLMLVGLVANVLILYSLTAYLYVPSELSNLAGIGAASLLRYWLSIRFTWIKKEEESVVPPAEADPVS